MAIDNKEELLIKEKIKTVLEARELDDDQRAAIEEAKAEKKATLEKIKTVFEAKEEVLEQAAEEIAPEFDYEQAAEEIEMEEAAAEFKVLYGIELLWDEYAHRPLPPELESPSRIQDLATRRKLQSVDSSLAIFTV